MEKHWHLPHHRHDIELEKTYNLFKMIVLAQSIFFLFCFGSIFWSASWVSLLRSSYLTMAAVRRRWMEGVYAHAPGPDSCKSYTPGWNICWRTNLWEFDLPLSCSEEHRPPLLGRCFQQAPVFHHETALCWSSHVLVCLNWFYCLCFFFLVIFQRHHILLSFINLFTVVSCGKKFGLKNMSGMNLKRAFCKQIPALKKSTLSSPATGWCY